MIRKRPKSFLASWATTVCSTKARFRWVCHATSAQMKPLPLMWLFWDLTLLNFVFIKDITVKFESLFATQNTNRLPQNCCYLTLSRKHFLYTSFKISVPTSQDRACLNYRHHAFKEIIAVCSVKDRETQIFENMCKM